MVRVVIPHVYNGRNKTFFFGSLGLYYARQGNAGLLATVPTQAMLGRRFQSVSRPPTEPRSRSSTRRSGYACERSFPGNMIPPTRITSMAREIVLLHTGAGSCRARRQ